MTFLPKATHNAFFSTLSLKFELPVRLPEITPTHETRLSQQQKGAEASILSNWRSVSEPRKLNPKLRVPVSFVPLYHISPFQTPSLLKLADGTGSYVAPLHEKKKIDQI